MITKEQAAEVVRLFHAEKWKIGTIAAQLGLHHGTVRRTLAREGVAAPSRVSRPSIVAPYVPLIVETLETYPRLPASRLYAMAKERGYQGSPITFDAQWRSTDRVRRRKRTCGCARCPVNKLRSTGRTSARISSAVQSGR